MEVRRKLPENIFDGHYQYFEPNLKINIPEPGHQFISKSILLFANGIVINRLHVERQSLLYDTRLKEIGGIYSLVKEIFKSVVLQRFKFLSDNREYVIIINEWTNNYFHWFTEAIPKLIYMLEHRKMPIVLLPAHYKAAYQLRSLELLGFSYKKFDSRILLVKNVFLPNRLAPSSAQYNPSIMRKLSCVLKSKVTLDLDMGSRIFISRKGAGKRRILNEDKVLGILKEFNFCVLQLEDYTLDKQIAIMHNTDILVSTHGAGLTNMIFCNPGAIVLELSLENQVMDKCYFNLSNAMGLNYYYQFCKSTNSKCSSYVDTDLLVNLTELRKNLLLVTNK